MVLTISTIPIHQALGLRTLNQVSAILHDPSSVILFSYDVPNNLNIFF